MRVSENEAVSASESTAAQVHIKRAEALTNLGRGEQALAQAHAAIALDPSRYEAWLEGARALLELGRPEEALEFCDKGLACRPQSVWAHRLRSFTLSRLGRHEDALAAVQAALAIDPAETASLRRQARCLWSLNRRLEALARIREAVAAEPEHPEGHGFLSDVCYGMKIADEGLASARRAVALAPSLAWPLNCLGDALDQSGEPEAAAQAFLRSIRMDPTRDYPKKRLLAVVDTHLRPPPDPWVLAGVLVGLLGLVACIVAQLATDLPWTMVALVVATLVLAGRRRQRRHAARLDAIEPGMAGLVTQLRAAQPRKRAGRR